MHKKTTLAQIDSTRISIKHPKRLKTFAYTAGGAYIGSMAGLYVLWYDQNTTSQFRWFDDWHEWKQVDKVGHFYSTFHISQTTAEALQWAGMTEKKADLWAMLVGITLMTPIEIFDGFSTSYGASYSDWIANSIGAVSFWTQKKIWQEVRLQPKFSFHRTPFAPQRPNLLGNGWHQEWLKDYNGQTYWVSVDIDKFIRQKYIPKWLNLAVGYGAENMLFAQDAQNRQAGLNPERQWYISIDWDLTAIKTKKRWLKALLKPLQLIKLPAPTLQYTQTQGWKGFWLYF